MKESIKTVGLAINAEKAKKHLSPKLVQLAAEAGIALKVIDLDKDFEVQEPFDVLLHKVRCREWHDRLDLYRKKNKTLKVVDKLSSVLRLSKRTEMLVPMENDIILTMPVEKEKQGVPSFIEAGSRFWERVNSSAERRQQVLTVGSPKQIVIEEDGRPGSHGLVVIEDYEGLKQMINGPRPSSPSLPIVLQEYIPHGACLFKVYVMGPITILVRRPSLLIPVPSSDIEETVGEIKSVGRVSSSFSSSQLGNAPQEEPPNWAIQSLAQELRRRYEMDLFNFDLIQPDLDRQTGYEKLPDYEELYVAFLKSLFVDRSHEQKLTRFVVSPRVSAKTMAA